MVSVRQCGTTQCFIIIAIEELWLPGVENLALPTHVPPVINEGGDQSTMESFKPLILNRSFCAIQDSFSTAGRTKLRTGIGVGRAVFRCDEEMERPAVEASDRFG